MLPRLTLHFSSSVRIRTLHRHHSAATRLGTLLRCSNATTVTKCAARSLTTSSLSLAQKSRLLDEVFAIYHDEQNKIFTPKFFKDLENSGIRRDDPRLAEMYRQAKEGLRLMDYSKNPCQLEQVKRTNNDNPAAHSDSYLNANGSPSLPSNLIHDYGKDLYFDKDSFQRCIGDCEGIIGKALKKQLVIPDWQSFTKVVGEIFEDCRQYNTGSVATGIPQLSCADPERWAMSICTIDGQRANWGDANTPFCLQSVSKPFTYALVHDEIGPDQLHNHVGQEPSGRLFNEIALDQSNKPHNPLVNAGAIVCASMMKRQASLSERYDFAVRQYRRFCGNGYIGFNNAVFLSERETADRNYALFYYMREHNVFPPETNLQDTLDFYFQLCSIETNCYSMAVMAATLANGGVNPMSNERVINNKACRDTLSLMYSCGMYDWSGQFAFRVGLPAKSGVSGALIIVIPNLMGIALYSPRLDDLGNSVRGVKFAEELVAKFNFHNYDSLIYSGQKLDPRKATVESEQDSTLKLLFAANLGDISAIKRYLLSGINIHERDYDERTVLHVAASVGDYAVLEYLLRKWKESPEPRDRFGRTPLDDATFFKHESCAELLRATELAWRAPDIE